MTFTKPRGLANLTPERRREIAASGGAAVAPENRTFAKDRDLAVEAGRRSKRPSKKPAAQQET